MKETGLIFKAPMVRAILEGRKTQTRRIVKPQPYVDKMGNACWDGKNFGQDVLGTPLFSSLASPLPCSKTKRVHCPMGQPGDRIYVRETARSCRAYEVQGYPPSQWGNKPIWFEADGTPPGAETAWATKATPAIHLPMFAARIWLEVTGVRVERLHTITEADAVRDGGLHRLPATGRYVMNQGDQYFGLATHDPRELFREIWESTGGDWNANPWVWAIDFKVLSATGRPA